MDTLIEYTVLIPVGVTATSPTEALKYALDDVRDPTLMKTPWMGFVAEGDVSFPDMDMAGIFERVYGE